MSGQAAEPAGSRPFIHPGAMPVWIRIAGVHPPFILFILSPGRPRFGSSSPAGISFIHPSLASLHHPRDAPLSLFILSIRPLPSGSTFHCPAGGDRTYSYPGRRLLTPRVTISSGRSSYSSAHRPIPCPIHDIGLFRSFIHTRRQSCVR
jgi:hypothetical protein